MDVGYTVTTRRHGKVFELIIISVPYIAGRLLGWAGGCDVHRWHSLESNCEDCRILGTARSRSITLNTPMGWDVAAELWHSVRSHP